jgi:transposase InsO family protein
MVPPDVFSRDLHQPLVKTDDTSEPEKASALPEAPSAQPDAPSAQPEAPSAPEREALRNEEERNGSRLIKTGRPCTFNISTEESCPSTEPKLGDWRGAPSRSSCWGREGALPPQPLRHPPAMHIHHRRSGVITRNTLGGLRSSRSASSPCWKHFPTRFLWPTAVADATRIVRTCQGCQFYARQTHLPAQALQTIPITWSFAVWGLDLVGPLQKAPGGYPHLLVAIDKFSKWIEVRPLNSIRSEQAVAFFTNIIHRFGVPNSIITDNDTQFTGRKFLDFCEDHHIRVDWAAVAHPMTNGQVERANIMILQGLKPRIYNDLNKFGRRWMKELPSVVWSLRTTSSRATGFTPFFLVYGTEAILPTDLEYGSPRTRAYDDQSNRTNREDSLDQLEEAREMALLHSARYQQSLRRYHARGVRSRDL